MDLSHQRATFIGTGQMAAALASGFVRTLLRPSQISGYDPAEPARRQFQQKLLSRPGGSFSSRRVPTVW